MLRFYLRIIFSRLERSFHNLKNYKKLHHNFIKPVIYRNKILKVLKINENKLSKKLETIEKTNKKPSSKCINYVR